MKSAHPPSLCKNNIMKKTYALSQENEGGGVRWGACPVWAPFLSGSMIPGK